MLCLEFNWRLLERTQDSRDQTESGWNSLRSACRPLALWERNGVLLPLRLRILHGVANLETQKIKDSGPKSQIHLQSIRVPQQKHKWANLHKQEPNSRLRLPRWHFAASLCLPQLLEFITMLFRNELKPKRMRYFYVLRCAVCWFAQRHRRRYR
jgi:hypothetical protein